MLLKSVNTIYYATRLLRVCLAKCLPFWRRSLPLECINKLQRRRKAWFCLRISRILFAAKHKTKHEAKQAKHSLTTLRMSRPLLVGSYV